MVTLIKHSTTNKINSNNNWCLTNHKGEIFIRTNKLLFLSNKKQRRNMTKKVAYFVKKKLSRSL